VELEIIVNVVRLIARVSFRQADNWSKVREAIIDTGGPISIIPHSIWQNIDYRLLSAMDFDVALAGIPTTGKLAQIFIRMHDDTNISQTLVIKAYLLNDDIRPLILGSEDFLTKVGLYSNYREEKAYLEFPQQNL
jgi:predicted aspartyl protease